MASRSTPGQALPLECTSRRSVAAQPGESLSAPVKPCERPRQQSPLRASRSGHTHRVPASVPSGVAWRDRRHPQLFHIRPAPALRNGRITFCQQEPSAQAPWTNTMVAFSTKELIALLRPGSLSWRWRFRQRASQLQNARCPGTRPVRSVYPFEMPTKIVTDLHQRDRDWSRLLSRLLF
jgi:hypothetical protein